MLWLAPMLAAVLGGEKGWPPAAYLHLAAAEVAVVMATNPFEMLTRCMSPPGRALIVGADVAAWVALTCQFLSLACRVYLIIAAVLMAAAAISQRRKWLTDSLIRQSGAVNRASGMLYGRGDHDALTEWERKGSAETRALIRQTLQLILDEDELHSKCKAVYVLGFLHGEAYSAKRIKALERKATSNEELRRRAESLRDELADKNEAIMDLEYQLRRAERLTQEANRRAAEAEARVEALGLTTAPEAKMDTLEDKKWAVYSHYKSTGDSMAKTGKLFGISSQTVKNYVDYCKNEEAS